MLVVHINKSTTTMMYPTIRLVYNRRKNATKKNAATVEIEVVYAGKQKRMSTGVRVFINQWDDLRQRVCNRDDMEELNDQLLQQVQDVHDAILSIFDVSDGFTFERLDFALNNKNSMTFIEYCEKQITDRKDIVPSTLKTHRSWLRRFKMQPVIRYLSDLTPAKIREYDNWLRNNTSMKNSTIWAQHKSLKVYVHRALADEIIGRDPYIGFKLPKPTKFEKVLRYLEEEEVMKIRSLNLSEQRFCKVRDLFIVQCYTGLAYVDLMKTDWTKVEEREGHYVLRDRRQKTHEPYYIMLLSPVMDILRRYDFVLPHIDMINYNKDLKCIQAIAGITTKITTHVGRHTFAVMMINRHIPIEIIAKMMGHSSTRTTEIYAEVLAKSVHDAYLSIDSMIE